MATFTSEFDVNDLVYIIKNDGTIGQANVLTLAFREGTVFTAFNPDTDFIYTMSTGEERAQQYTFSDKDAIIEYVNSLP